MIRRLALIGIATLPGCASVADAPSLAPRAVELRRSAVAPAPVENSTASAALAARIATLQAGAAQAEAAFRREERVIAGLPELRRAPNGSDRWVVFQTRLSALEVARHATRDALDAIEALIRTTEANIAIGASAEGIDELNAARTEIAAIDARQTGVLASLNR